MPSNDLSFIIPMLPAILTVFAFLLLAGAVSSKISSKLNMPVLLIFLVVGMLAGSEGVLKITFEDPAIANVIGSIAMAFILFSGGYDTKWKSVQKVIGYGSILSSIGVLITAIVVGCFVSFFLKVPLEWGLLLGAIVSSTDAAAVFSILRSRSVSLKGRLQPLLEYESGSNDPMAAFLTIFMIAMIDSPNNNSYFNIFPFFLMKMSIGILTGIFIGKLASWAFNLINLEYDGLYYVLGIGIVLLSYGLAELNHGNGFMAVYVCGMVMGNSQFIYQHGLGRFYDGISWLMQVLLFGLLGLLVFPSSLLTSAKDGFIIALFLLIVARPFAVFLCMIKSKYSWKERLFISWVGLRGGAPIMLATFPLMNSSINDSWRLFNIVFFIVIISVIIQGRTLMPLARYLKLDKPLKSQIRPPIEFENVGSFNGEIKEFEIAADSPIVNKTIAQLGLPEGAFILLIRRKENFIVPNGRIIINSFDTLLILVNPEKEEKIARLLGAIEDEEI